MKYTQQTKPITYNEVMEQIKNVPLEKMTKEQVFNRYVAYGRYEDFENVEIQKILCKYDLIEWLISSVSTIITDQSVIDDITSSTIVKSNEYQMLRGKIKSLELICSMDLPKGICLLSITIIGRTTKKEYKANYLYTKAEEKYKNEIEQNIGKPIIAVVKEQGKNTTPLLCCLLKSNKGIIVRI